MIYTAGLESFTGMGLELGCWWGEGLEGLLYNNARGLTINSAPRYGAHSSGSQAHTPKASTIVYSFVVRLSAEKMCLESSQAKSGRGEGWLFYGYGGNIDNKGTGRL